MDAFMKCSKRGAEDPDSTIENSQFEKLRRKKRKTWLS